MYTSIMLSVNILTRPCIYCDLFLYCMCADWTDFSTSFDAQSAVVTFLPNETSKTISVWSLQDDITEGTECLYFLLEPVDEFVNVSYNNETVTICIEDNDGESNYFCTCTQNLIFNISPILSDANCIYYIQFKYQ